MKVAILISAIAVVAIVFVSFMVYNPGESWNIQTSESKSQLEDQPEPIKQNIEEPIKQDSEEPIKQNSEEPESSSQDLIESTPEKLKLEKPNCAEKFDELFNFEEEAIEIVTNNPDRREEINKKRIELLVGYHGGNCNETIDEWKDSVDRKDWLEKIIASGVLPS